MPKSKPPAPQKIIPSPDGFGPRRRMNAPGPKNKKHGPRNFPEPVPHCSPYDVGTANLSLRPGFVSVRPVRLRLVLNAKKLAASFTEKELNGLMTTNSSGYVYQYYKNNTWFGIITGRCKIPRSRRGSCQ